jgi:hypothetical protein
MSGKALVGTKYAENSLTTQFTVSAGTYVLIDKITLSNDTAGSATISVYLVPSGGTAVASTTITIGSGEWMNAGDFISTNASAASTINLRISGRVFP